MAPFIRSLLRRASAPLPLLLLLIASAVGCFADTYSSEGTVYITGTVTGMQNPHSCDLYGCHLGSTWSLEMTFVAADWNAPDSSYFISTVLLNCIGGPPCITDYHATSDFGWGPYGFDILSVDIEGGKVVDARASTGGYTIEWGEENWWSYAYSISGTTTGYAVPTPDPATILSFATGVTLLGLSRYIRQFAR